jgi:hypothetical protein
MKYRNIYVAKLLALPFRKKTKHYFGLPPELARGEDSRQEMIRPTYLAIKVSPEGFFLYRYTSQGLFAGDTWHETLEDAKHQAHFEFGDFISDWQEIPSSNDNPIEFILAHLKIFNINYLVTVVAETLPVEKGPDLVAAVLADFAKRPWNKNVICTWNGDGPTLILQAENDFDRKGIVIKEDFCDALSSLVSGFLAENVRIASVKETSP